MSDPAPGKTYYSVQILRGVAALLVVLLHATLMGQERLNPSAGIFNAGNAGVDIFFAISGFTMVITTAGVWKQPGTALPFLRRRIIRIVPLYWIITLVEIAAILSFPTAMRHLPLLTWNTIASFLFIPAWDAAHNAHPIIDVGWTLSFEMLFYGLFAITLALRVLPMIWLTAVLLVLSALGGLRTDAWPAPMVLIDPMLTEFVLGMLVAQAVLTSRHLPLPLAIVVVFLMLAILITTNLLPINTYLAYRHLVWGVPGALLLWGMVSIEERTGSRFRTWTLPCLLGDASYAIYLSHDLILIALCTLLAKMYAGGALSMGLFLVLCLGVSCLVGIVLYLIIERPLLKWQRVAFKRIPSAPSDPA